ncbi:Amylopullulanase [Bifidobacterium goeldii]|uniref:Amylopullulanase n=1 Tax=Bifidobacterium goeldii TaxID=2306975 RepID=A0A430FCS1_9BIFI|nr:bacterial Ig-like domain-containing protein [Bifidobacterium goeldii]RSX50598.1 Amylopullulanase [Bifidobacterium goeldii]
MTLSLRTFRGPIGALAGVAMTTSMMLAVPPAYASAVTIDGNTTSASTDVQPATNSLNANIADNTNTDNTNNASDSGTLTTPDTQATGVAAIGDQTYATLKEAIAAAGENTVIELTADTTETVGISGKTGLTINGNGHSVAAININGTNTNLTLDNLVFIGTSGTQVQVYGTNTGTVISNSTFNITSASTWCALYVQNSPTNLTIEGNTFKMPVTTGSTQCIGFGGVASADGVLIKGNQLVSPEKGSGTYFFVMGWTTNTGDDNYGVKNLTIEGNTTDSGNGAAVYGAWLRNVDTVTATGNTFAGTVGVGLTSGDKIAPNRNVTIENNTSSAKYGLYVANSNALSGSVDINNNQGLSYTNGTLPTGVAHADGSFSYYKTLKEAVEAAHSSETVRVLGNVTLDADIAIASDITLTFRTASLTVDTAGYKITVANGASLTVDGLDREESGVPSFRNTVVPTAKNDPKTMFSVEEGGSLTINSGSFETKGAQVVSTYGATIINDGVFTSTATTDEMRYPSGKSMINVSGAAASLQFNAGTVTADTVDPDSGRALYGVYASNGASVTIGAQGSAEGPTITSGYPALALNNTTGTPKISITVNSGTLQAGLSDDTHDFSTLNFDAVMYASSDADITINGGTLQGTGPTTKVISLPYRNTTTNVTLNGGAYLPGEKAAVIWTGNKTGSAGSGENSLTVTGGTYKGTFAQFTDDHAFAEFITGGTFQNTDGTANKDAEQYVVPGKTLNSNGTVITEGSTTTPTYTARLEIAVKPGKTEYKIGEQFDATGMVVRQYNADGTSMTLAEDQYVITGFDSSKTGTVTVVITSKLDASLTATVDVTVQASATTVYRLYSPASGEHFYTANKAERKALLKLGWDDEGTAFTMSDDGTPVYRLYGAGTNGKHMFTTSKAEYNALKALGWADEGVAFRVPEGAQTKVYRLYNTSNGDHMFTTSVLEYTLLRILPWWNGEGIGFNAA